MLAHQAIAQVALARLMAILFRVVMMMMIKVSTMDKFTGMKVKLTIMLGRQSRRMGLGSPPGSAVRFSPIFSP